MFLIDIDRVIDDIDLTSPEKKKINFVCRINIDRTNVIDQQCSRIDQINKM